ncbi:MAG TPA: hypothetical protein VND80_08205 [Steroidobacteraceae bacterium]|nr:hypothetical protein [Steroidobacteraceae bacterium]
MAQVIVIGERQHCEYTPANPWIAVGGPTAEQTRVVLQSPLERKGVEKYFLRKVRTGSLMPVYETYVLKALGVMSLKGSGR